MERIVIPFSKVKLVKLFAISLIFLTLGFWMITSPPAISNMEFKNGVVKIVASYGGSFLGAAGICMCAGKLIKNKPAIILDESGILENITKFNLGLIPWSDVSEIYDHTVRVSVHSRQQFITIGLTDPDKYMKADLSSVKRKIMETNIRYYGSPLTIHTNQLSIGHEELLILIQEKKDEYLRSRVIA